jgi:hypothetical protein
VSGRGAHPRQGKAVMLKSPLPTPREIEEDPELAVLAAVAPALGALASALLAAHPVICDDERPYWLSKPSPAAGVARQMVTAAGRLGRLIERYRRLVANEEERRGPHQPVSTDF